MFQFVRPCTIIQKTEGSSDDGYGNKLAGTVHVETVCEIQQTATDEPERKGETSQSTWSLFLPVDTDLDTSDQVIVDGRVYEVVGEPWNADTGSPMVHHMEATVVRSG